MPLQYGVPQFVEREKKLLGPLTVRQTIILGITAFILIVSYFVLDFIAFVVLAVILGSSAAALAFIKINKRPLTKVIFSFIKYFIHPKTYVWEKKSVKTFGSEKKKGEEKKTKQLLKNEEEKEVKVQNSKKPSEKEIDRLSQALDQ